MNLGMTSLIGSWSNSFIKRSTSGRDSWTPNCITSRFNLCDRHCCATNAVLGHTNIVARTQFPDRIKSHGWIATDPRARTYLASDEVIPIWVHEIGHLLGLKHNPSPGSVFYFIDAGASSKLDSTDLRALALLHCFRSRLECSMCSIPLDKRAGPMRRIPRTNTWTHIHLDVHIRNAKWT